MWASFEMLDTFYGCMALLYHFVRNSLQLHNPYFILSRMTIVPKFFQFFTGIYSIFKELFCVLFIISTEILHSKVFFRQKRLMIFSKKWHTIIFVLSLYVYLHSIISEMF